MRKDVSVNPVESELQEVISAINQAWRTSRPSALKRYLHPDIVMKMPGFAGEVAGRDALISGFEDFCVNARVLEYAETDQQINVIGTCAVVSFHFEMLYEREAYRERSKGRDLWVFQRLSDRWLAVWRTMLELNEVREPRT